VIQGNPIRIPIALAVLRLLIATRSSVFQYLTPRSLIGDGSPTFIGYSLGSVTKQFDDFIKIRCDCSFRALSWAYSKYLLVQPETLPD